MSPPEPNKTKVDNDSGRDNDPAEAFRRSRIFNCDPVPMLPLHYHTYKQFYLNRTAMHKSTDVMLDTLISKVEAGLTINVSLIAASV